MPCWDATVGAPGQLGSQAFAERWHSGALPGQLASCPGVPLRHALGGRLPLPVMRR